MDARPDAWGRYQILGYPGVATDLPRKRSGGIVPVLHSGFSRPGIMTSQEKVEQAE